MNTSPLPVEEAQRLVWDAIAPLGAIRVPLPECAGCTLAEDAVADQDVPRFDKAMMDGFAVRWEDTASACESSPAALTVVERIPAGAVARRRIGPGEAARIMTGAPVPPGADAVCRFEHTADSLAPDAAIARVTVPVRHGDNIARRGEDIPAGAIALPRGTTIDAGGVAVLATFGVAQPLVVRKPVVAVMATGTELVDAHEPLAPGKIRNSNSYMMAELIREAGGVPLLIGPLPDEEDKLADAIGAKLGGIDMLVTSGGVSVGDYDIIPGVWERLGARTLFWKARMRPGSPMRFGMCGAVPFFGVSGNPAACFVNMQLFVLPALRRLLGRPEPLPPLLQARLGVVPLLRTVGAARYLRGTVAAADGRLVADVATGQSAAMIGSIAGANALICIKGGELPREGELVDALLYGPLKRKETPPRQ